MRTHLNVRTRRSFHCLIGNGVVGDIEVLMEIQNTSGSSMIYIAHDLSVDRYFSDDIAVIRLGKICRSQDPPWRQNGQGRRILFHIPIEDLNRMDPVVHRPADSA